MTSELHGIYLTMLLHPMKLILGLLTVLHVFHKNRMRLKLLKIKRSALLALVHDYWFALMILFQSTHVPTFGGIHIV